MYLFRIVGLEFKVLLKVSIPISLFTVDCLLRQLGFSFSYLSKLD